MSRSSPEPSPSLALPFTQYILQYHRSIKISPRPSARARYVAFGQAREATAATAHQTRAEAGVKERHEHDRDQTARVCRRRGARVALASDNVQLSGSGGAEQLVARSADEFLSM